MIDIACTPSMSPIVTRTVDGEILVVPEQGTFGSGREECYVPYKSVAVLAMDAADVPPGAADLATPVAFEQLDADESGEPRVESVELDNGGADRPPVARDHRRFGFVRPGCDQAAAEVAMSPAAIDAWLVHDEPGSGSDCAVAVWFVAVFDVPTDLVPHDAVPGAIR